MVGLLLPAINHPFFSLYQTLTTWFQQNQSWKGEINIAGTYWQYPQYRTPKDCECGRVSAVSNNVILEVEKARMGTVHKEPKILSALAA